MHFNINVGLFVPKPHTPYQLSPQLDEAEAVKKMEFIRNNLKPLGHKVSVSDTLTSRIEGIISRGDERAGLLFEQAYLAGSRLDSWSEYIDRDKWLSLFFENEELIDLFMKGKTAPPWQGIDSCVSEEYIRSEKEKSDNGQLTPTCKEKCSLCGVCGEDISIIKNTHELKEEYSTTEYAEFHGVKDDYCIKTPCYSSVVNSFLSDGTNDIDNPGVNSQNPKVYKNKMDPDIYRLLFSFSKTKSAVFHGHLSLIEIFSMAFTRASIPVMYTKGFNPIPKMEFASPLSVGINAEREIASVDFLQYFSPDNFINGMNLKLPQGFCIENAECFYIPSGMKKHSLSSLLWGFGYLNKDTTDYVCAKDEKTYRNERLKECETIFSLRRNYVLAKNITGNLSPEWSSYFDAYSTLYNGRQNIHYD